MPPARKITSYPAARARIPPKIWNAATLLEPRSLQSIHEDMRPLNAGGFSDAVSMKRVPFLETPDPNIQMFDIAGFKMLEPEEKGSGLAGFRMLEPEEKGSGLAGFADKVENSGSIPAVAGFHDRLPQDKPDGQTFHL